MRHGLNFTWGNDTVKIWTGLVFFFFFSLSHDCEIHHDWFGQTAEETIMNISSIFGESGASFVIHHILWLEQQETASQCC